MDMHACHVMQVRPVSCNTGMDGVVQIKLPLKIDMTSLLTHGKCGFMTAVSRVHLVMIAERHASRASACSQQSRRARLLSDYELRDALPRQLSSSACCHCIIRVYLKCLQNTQGRQRHWRRLDDKCAEDDCGYSTNTPVNKTHPNTKIYFDSCSFMHVVDHNLLIAAITFWHFLGHLALCL